MTYEYDETAKAGIENVRCGHFKLNMNHQPACADIEPKVRVTNRVEMHDLRWSAAARRHGSDSASRVCRMPVVEFAMVVKNVKMTRSDSPTTRKVERVGRDKVG